jgi:hypothetical protein
MTSAFDDASRNDLQPATIKLGVNGQKHRSGQLDPVKNA